MNKEDKNERRAITFCWEVCWTYETTEKTFSISDIEKSYNLERKKLGKSAVKLTNMERLTIESRLLKNQILQRTYKMTGYHKPCQVVFFS